MSKKPLQGDPPVSTLRVQAEWDLAEHPQVVTRARSADELLHELQVHQVELEMQNEALREAQAELEQSRDRYASLFEFAPIAYITLTEAGLIAEANLAAATLLGCERKHLHKRRFDAFVADDDGHRWQHLFSSMRGQQGSQTLNVGLRRSDGSRLFAEMTCSHTGNDGGQASLRLALSDVTERRHAEESLRRSRTRLASFIKCAPTCIAMFDRDMNYLSHSGRWLEEFGSGCADLSGRNHYEAHPDLPAHWKSIHQHGLAGETLKNDEEVWIRADASKHWMRWVVQPWIDEDGAIGGIIVFAEDVTDRKLAELALMEQEARYRAVIETAADGIWVVDEQGRFLLVNEAYVRRSGYSREELLSMHIADVEVQESDEDVRAHIERIRRNHSDLFETRHRAKSGEVWPAEVSASYSTAAW